MHRMHNWDQLGDEFDGCTELHCLMPNYGPASLAWQRGQAAGVSEEGSGHTSTTDGLPPAADLVDVHADQGGDEHRAKQKNRQAQKRFRDRQRVSVTASWTPAGNRNGCIEARAQLCYGCM